MDHEYGPYSGQWRAGYFKPTNLVARPTRAPNQPDQIILYSTQRKVFEHPLCFAGFNTGPNGSVFSLSYNEFYW